MKVCNRCGMLNTVLEPLRKPVCAGCGARLPVEPMQKPMCVRGDEVSIQETGCYQKIPREVE